MSTLAWHDRLRLERAVWAFDHMVQDLPRKSRLARRRELRDNLQSAAEDVGAVTAVRQLGDLRQLAVATSVGGAWRPGAYVVLVLVTVVAGRLWRLLPGLAPTPQVAT